MRNNDEDFFTVNKASEFLGISVKTVRRWAQQGKLRGIKIGSRGDWRFTKYQLLKLVKKSA
ncbi:hypothetical protein A3D05_05750 [Candidatus Gottesmanbacteria bacterium RIFCSPHIGHO2_02_FULL_40_24]|uniref:Helix-turn-helix domain-containing protein n=1 Tax=Candidatus Gottesmanbacteria bacterium RIFCSPHIGHO2_01_FULL_40_15 TaxID=1798376 RepID=A0A1F5Z6Z9_9BACT|nr:MAG: hypothetical protein A2777_02385 [Candidatus Gottesmanbacteria bacterium RIFCSPHIGHO2_01_FULL_40_15]OGG16532.1 MAG: hypothetical protein A3D05_05750 [Candidatus Gottesmanbacteria bacterium RIFCSPHIGHO2_02_FULL_40_24]OGG22609.1 MAG: hypothetical protein A3B48_02230 [Candidatus Gottesmanbacteria bacterium RIFCSPLOWO2_01_FULL_40_10]OGG25645.1 MAG: hypothetical protein A3E42_04900 [Candidatus Gottesmanbacteria bacterium RIFCSPHIGHO2_12_FULL_40_13]OGG32648.1 MAG: hypothetical protein A3I80_0